MDAAPEDTDVLLLQVSASLFDTYFDTLPGVFWTRSDDSSLIFHPALHAVERLIQLLEPFQEAPQLIDPHLPRFLTPLNDALVAYLPQAVEAVKQETPAGTYPLLTAVARVLYTLVKIRGHKVVCRFFPNEPQLLEPVWGLFESNKETVGGSWSLRYVLLLWLSHLLLAPFDLSTISENITASNQLDGTALDIPGMPSLSKRLLGLGIQHLSSASPRESDAATLLLIRMALRRDMTQLGLLRTMVRWGSEVIAKPPSKTHDSSQLFLKTGTLAVLAGFLAQGESSVVKGYASEMFQLVTKMEDEGSEDWSSAGVRRLGMKIYRWVATLSLIDANEGVVEDIIERLLNSLGDKDTAVRFGASKSLAMVARKLDADMAGDVVEAVMSVYEEDVYFDPPIAEEGKRRRKILTAVTAEKWHGATLTMATFLRQRAVRTTKVLERVLSCIVEALSFEQRKSTFAVGGNVRDAACYAAWSLARSYSTEELLASGKVVLPCTVFTNGRTMIQLLATELVTAACLDPLGNVRRASSAALQELVGRHPGCISNGINLVQVVDYMGVALRRRSVIDIAEHTASLDDEYWQALAYGIINGWRGVGSSDHEGRKLGALSLGRLMKLENSKHDPGRLTRRIAEIVNALLERVRTEGHKHAGIFHGCLWALAETLDVAESYRPALSNEENTFLQSTIFAKLKGRDFTNPLHNPELVSEACSRLVRTLANRTREGLLRPAAQSLRVWAAIIETSLDHKKDVFLSEAVLAAEPFLLAISERNRHNLVEFWCRRITSSSYRNRGHILALGSVIAPDTQNIDSITTSLLSVANKSEDVELRAAAVKALTSGILTRGITTDHLPEIIETVSKSLDDYTTDTRGDVGSWVRAEAVLAVVGIAAPRPQMLICKLIRLAFERLDRLRQVSAAGLLAIAPSEPSLQPITALAAVPPTSSVEYFLALLKLLEVEELAESLVEGLVTSTGGGSASTLQTSRTALIRYLDGRKDSPIIQPLLAVLSRAVESQNERLIASSLDTIALLLDSGLFPLKEKLPRRLFVLTQKAHFKTSSMARLSGALRVYTSLGLENDEIRQEILAKLAKMLLHPFPRVRKETAGAVWVLGGEKVEDTLADTDWGRNVKTLREVAGKVQEAVVGL